MGAVGLLLGGGLVSSPVGSKDVVPSAVVALVGQCDQPGGGQLAGDAPDPGRGQVMDGAGQGAGDPADLAVGGGNRWAEDADLGRSLQLPGASPCATPARRS